MGVRKHGDASPRLRHLRNGGGHLVHGGAERLLAIAQHERVGHVVDVLARAGEVDELKRLRAGLPERGGELLLEEILYRLDVVVRRPLDFLDAPRVGDRKLRHDSGYCLRLRGS